MVVSRTRSLYVCILCLNSMITVVNNYRLILHTLALSHSPNFFPLLRNSLIKALYNFCEGCKIFLKLSHFSLDITWSRLWVLTSCVIFSKYGDEILELASIVDMLLDLINSCELSASCESLAAVSLYDNEPRGHWFLLVLVKNAVH